MKRRRMILVLTIGLLLLALSGIFQVKNVRTLVGAAAQTERQEDVSMLPWKDVYAVKFLCGSFLPKLQTPPDQWEGPVKPGNYLTAINVHNPNSVIITFQKKAVLLYRADKPPEMEQPMPPGQLKPAGLKPDWGFEIDCADIRKVLLQGEVPAPIFIKGWVVIEVKATTPNQEPLKLDVTAVYTGHGWSRIGDNKPVWEGFAEDVEAVLPKRVK